MSWNLRILIAVPFCMLLTSCTKGAPSVDDITAYGECPKCGTRIRGGLVKWDGVTADGKPVSGVDYKADCESCDLPLFSKDIPDPETRKVNWRAIQSQDSNKAMEGTDE